MPSQIGVVARTCRMSSHSCSCSCAVIAVTDRVIAGCDGGSHSRRTGVHHVTISTTTITSLLIHAIAIHMTMLIHATCTCTHTTTDITTTTTAAADTDWGGWMIGTSTTMMRLVRMTTINRNGYVNIHFLLVFGIDTQ